jgi:glucose-specific phosphotransferase system IIA component
MHLLEKGFEMFRKIGRALMGQTAVQPAAKDGLAANVLKALGGRDNLTDIDACFTRLRVTVKKTNLVDKEALKHLGAKGVLEIGQNFQVVFGTQSDTLKGQIKEIIYAEESGRISSGEADVPSHIPQGSKAEYPVYAPVCGEVIDLSAVPDPVFAEKMMGDGFAIKPTNGLVLSPVKGKVMIAFPTKHAVGLISEDGLEILVHVGIDTVKLKGEGFELLIEEGDTVKVGTPLLKVDLAYVEAQATSSITPVVFTNLKGQTIVVHNTTAVAGETVVCMVRSGQ